MRFRNKKEFKDWNEKMFRKYNNERIYLHPNPAIRFVEERRIRTILKFGSIRHTDNVLEVGCGEGYILNRIHYGRLYGVDISRTAIDRARKKLSSKPNVKKLVIGSAEKLPFATDSFDVVICSEVIEHVPNPSKIIAEIARVAKPDARIIITFPNEPLINSIKQIVLKTGLFDVLLKNVPKKMDDEWHLHSFNLALFKSVVKPYLTIERMRGLPLSLLPIRYAALCRIK